MAADPHRQIRETLAAVRRRARSVRISEGALRAAAWAGALVVVAVLALAQWPSSTLRALLLIAAGGGAAAWIAVEAWRIVGATRHVSQLAALVERRLPALRTDVRTALDFAERGGAEAQTTAALRAALIERVADHLRAERGAALDAVPRRPQRVASVVLTVATGVALLAATFAPSDFRRGVRLLVGGVPDAAEAEDAALDERPLIASVDLVVTPPDYTQFPPQSVMGSTGDFRALVGSTVRLTATAFDPVEAATLRIEPSEGDAQRVRAEVIAQRAVRAVFTIDGSATYTFVLEAGGDRRLDPQQRRIIAVPDAPPRIELTAPTADLEVTPDHVVNLEYLASDDFGLSQIRLAWAFVGHEDESEVVPLQAEVGAQTFEEHVPFDLGPLALQPRDEVLVWVEALDNDTYAGPKVGRSRAVVLRVSSPDARHDEVLALKDELFEALLARLADGLPPRLTRAVANDAGDALDTKPVQAEPPELGRRLRAQLATFGAWPETIGLYDRLIEALAADELSTPGDAEILRATHARLTTSWRDAANALARFERLGPEEGVPQAAFNPAAAAMGDLIDTTERSLLVLEDLIATHRAGDVERRLGELDEIRERLRELLEAYRNAPDEETRAQIERELRRLEQRMRELLSQLAQQVDQLPYEHLNMEALEPSELSENVTQMTSSLDQLREMLDQGNIDGAMEALEQMTAGLDFMQQELGDPMAGAQPQTLSELDQRMAELMDEVNTLETAEQAIEADTQALEAEMREQRQAEIQEQLDQVLESARQEIAERREAIETTPDERLGDASQEALQRTEDQLERLEELLEQRDLTGAEEAANQLMSQMQDTEYELRRDESLLLRDRQGFQQATQMRQNAQRAEEAVERVQQQLESMMQMSQPRPTAAQRGQLQQLGEQQGQVQQRLGQLQQQVQEAGERFPMIQQGLEGPLGQVGEAMGESQQALRQGQPRPAMRGQQSALEGLRQMRQQMQQMMQQQRQQQNNGRQQQQERVGVPQEGDAQREGYRERIIDAMREDSLDAYEDDLRDYYERLLQ